MINQILQKAADAIGENVAGITRSYGLVHTLVQATNNGRIYRYPSVQENGQHEIIVPDKNTPVVSFFQFLNHTEQNLSRGVLRNSVVRFVIWANTKALDTDNLHALYLEAFAAMKNADLSTECCEGAHIHPDMGAGAADGVFSDYSFDEAREQYKTFPYRYHFVPLRLLHVYSPECTENQTVSPVQIDC